MENPKKRKRSEMASTGPVMGDSALSQSKTTRLRRDIDNQIAFL